MTQDEALKIALEALQFAYNHCDSDWVQDEKINPAITAIKEALAQPEQEPVNYEKLAALGWQSIECPFCGSAGAQAFPQRPRVVFPTMLRKMWSGGEVQAWLDENVNKENT